MAFGFGKDIAVLESKFNIYEDLSKEMLDKLERAVATISDNSNKIAIILERHENKLAESDKADALLLKMVEEMKEKNSKEHQLVCGRIDRLDSKIHEISRFRWIVVGISIAAITIIQSAQFFSPLFLTKPEISATVSERIF